GIRAAKVELAEYDGRPGCISRNFVDVAEGQALVHGNEILALRVTGYERTKRFRQSDHTLENIDAAMRRLFSSDQAEAVLTELAGYMVLDALIGNTDRHHENWGLLVHSKANPGDASLGVAPSFDHASSLGRELREERCLALLASDGVGAYIRKGRGGIFRSPNDPHGENPLRFVEVAVRAYPSYFRPAIERVVALPTDTVWRIMNALPPSRASTTAKQFAVAMILHAQKTLIETLK
ncbi:MAG TPA: HipA domain-containing protein, partial [Burkholderiaceae bacterium]|nr:HipA domain-containing protein [Burkholderiaceae bacterium]